MTLASIADAVITVAVDGTVEFLNPVAERLTGWTNAEAHGRAITDVFPVRDESSGHALGDPVLRSLREATPVKSEGNVALGRRTEAPVAIDYSAAPIRDRAGTTVGAVLVFHDMSRERQYASAARAPREPRRADRPAQPPRVRAPRQPGAERAAQIARHHAVLYLDLDQFKLVNDTCGHAAGDELMRQVGALLRPRLRDGDTLARLGGDEFGVLLENCPPSAAARIAETLRRPSAISTSSGSSGRSRSA